MQATHQSKSRGAGFEYALYFALILAISLPTALIRQLLPRRGQPRRFFVTEAWAMAQRTTPQIFAAF